MHHEPAIYWLTRPKVWLQALLGFALLITIVPWWVLLGLILLAVVVGKGRA